MGSEATGSAGPAPLQPTLLDACERWGPRPAVTCAGRTLTYAEVGRRAAALAATYERLGIGRGDRVLCQFRNEPELVVAIAAAWLRGAVHVGADNDLTGRELVRLVERLEAAAVLYQPPGRHRDDEGGLAPLVTVSDAFPDTPLVVHGARVPVPVAHHGLADLLATGEDVSPVLVDPLDPALVFLTSGTTGEPKAVVETFAAHWAKMQFFADASSPGEDDVHLLYLPMSHVFGSRLGLMALLRGGRLVLQDRFSPVRALDLVSEEGVTVVSAVPTHLRLLRDRYDPARHDVGALRTVLCAAAPLPRELARWVYDTLTAQIVFVYGCSEGFTTLTADRDEVLAGSVGCRVFRGPPGTPADGRVAVVDPDEGSPLPAGEVGEIVFGAATPVRYWDAPDTATDGWYRTGDLGRLDDAGRLYVTGRLKELINRGGLHVSIAEVESALLRHPGVADGAVIATPDPVLGEAVCACVVPRDSAALTLDGVRAFLGDSLARHKLPDELCVVETVPRTDIGKVDRRALRARVLDGGVRRQRARGR